MHDPLSPKPSSPHAETRGSRSVSSSRILDAPGADHTRTPFVLKKKRSLHFVFRLRHATRLSLTLRASLAMPHDHDGVAQSIDPRQIQISWQSKYGCIAPRHACVSASSMSNNHTSSGRPFVASGSHQPVSRARRQVRNHHQTAAAAEASHGIRPIGLTGSGVQANAYQQRARFVERLLR